ncbi:hypothetical protein FP804_02355 [archaeon]|nr:hypothetical protein [archaeon]
MERLSKQQERLKAQRKRIEMQQRRKAQKGISGEDTPNRTIKQKRKGWKAVEPKKETGGIAILKPQKQSKSSAKWDRGMAKWDKRARKHRW